MSTEKTFTRQFCQMLERDNFVILDTETTGIAKPAEIVEIAVLSRHGEILLDQRVKPTHTIPDAVSAIHGITDALVANCPSWPEVRSRLIDVIAGRDVIVYNAVYDRKIMHWSDEAHGLEHYDYKAQSAWFCAMEEFAEYYGERHPTYGSYTWKPLAFAARFMEIENDVRLHSALGDCILTLKLCEACTKQLAVWIPF